MIKEYLTTTPIAEMPLILKVVLTIFFRIKDRLTYYRQIIRKILKNE